MRRSAAAAELRESRDGPPAAGPESANREWYSQRYAAIQLRDELFNYRFDKHHRWMTMGMFLPYVAPGADKR